MLSCYIFGDKDGDWDVRQYWRVQLRRWIRCSIHWTSWPLPRGKRRAERETCTLQLEMCVCVAYCVCVCVTGLGFTYHASTSLPCFNPEQTGSGNNYHSHTCIALIYPQIATWNFRAFWCTWWFEKSQFQDQVSQLLIVDAVDVKSYVCVHCAHIGLLGMCYPWYKYSMQIFWFWCEYFSTLWLHWPARTYN